MNQMKRNKAKCNKTSFTRLSVEAVAKRPGTAMQKVSAQAGLSWAESLHKGADPASFLAHCMPPSHLLMMHASNVR